MENFRLNVLLKDVNENKTQAGVNALFEEIVVKAQFLSVVIETEEIQENGEPVMRMPMLTAGDGKGFYPVFTDQENLEKWEQMKAAKTLTLTFDDYADMMQKNGQAAGIVINPFSHNFVLVREMIADLKKGRTFCKKA